MKIKTAEATGLQLDWGLGLAMDLSPIVHKTLYVRPATSVHALTGDHQGSRYYKEFNHTDPAVCMGLIERHKIDITHESNCICASGQEWSAEHDLAYGKTLAQAVARCVISMKLGDEFECPDELGGV